MYYKSNLKNSKFNTKYFIIGHLSKLHHSFSKKHNLLQYCRNICKRNIIVIFKVSA
jgi:hypothetical protein